MIDRRRFVLAGGAGLSLAACGEGDEGPGGPGQIVFSILPTAPVATLERNWRPVLTDMAKITGLRVKPFIPSSYAVLVEAMKVRQTDAGWFSNEAGLEAVRRARGEVFARTQGPGGVDGYQSVLIVNARRGVTLDRILKCDRSLSFGQAEPISTSGYVAPIAFFFGPNDIQPQKCFAAVRTGDHNDNLLAVASGTLDVATSNTGSLALNRGAGRHEADAVKVVWTSPTLPDDPIIWRKDLDPVVKEKLRQFFFTYAQGDTSEAERQRDNLKPLYIGGFKPADDSHLMMVREVEARETWVLARWSGDKAKTAEAKRTLDAVVAQREALEGRTRALAGTQ